jgi:hypothetical protein
MRQSWLGNGGLECSGRTRLRVARSLGGDSFAKALLELVGFLLSRSSHLVEAIGRLSGEGVGG